MSPCFLLWHPRHSPAHSQAHCCSAHVTGQDALLAHAQLAEAAGAFLGQTGKSSSRPVLNPGLCSHGTSGVVNVLDSCLGTILAEGTMGESGFSADFRGSMGSTKRAFVPSCSLLLEVQ